MGGGIAPENHFEEGDAGCQGAAGQGRWREGTGCGIAPENHSEEGDAGCQGAAGNDKTEKMPGTNKYPPAKPGVFHRRAKPYDTSHASRRVGAV